MQLSALGIMKKKADLQIKYLIDGDAGLLKAIVDSDNYLLSLMKPKDFDTNNYGSDINRIDSSFEKLCTTLEELGIHKPKELTLYEFESKILYFNEKNKKK